MSNSAINNRKVKSSTNANNTTLSLTFVTSWLANLTIKYIKSKPGLRKSYDM